MAGDQSHQCVEYPGHLSGDYAAVGNHLTTARKPTPRSFALNQSAIAVTTAQLPVGNGSDSQITISLKTLLVAVVGCFMIGYMLSVRRRAVKRKRKIEELVFHPKDYAEPME